jgi:hypothetical protein
MSVVQSLAVASAALVMSYASAGPPVAMRAAFESAAAAAESAQVTAELTLLNLIGGADAGSRTSCQHSTHYGRL